MKHKTRVTTQTAKTSENASDNWRTPEEVLECVREYAPIGLDPCTDGTNPTRARVAFTKKTPMAVFDFWAAQMQQGECVWCNPPFSLKDLWFSRAICAADEYPVFVLCRVSHTAKWWREMAEASDVVMYWRKRLKFIDPVKGSESPAPFDTAIFGLNVSYRRCVQAFSEHAWVEVTR